MLLLIDNYDSFTYRRVVGAEFQLGPDRPEGLSLRTGPEGSQLNRHKGAAMLLLIDNYDSFTCRRVVGAELQLGPDRPEGLSLRTGPEGSQPCSF